VTIVDRTARPPVGGVNGSTPDGAEAAVVLGDRLRDWIDAGYEVTVLVRPAGLETGSETLLTAAAMNPDGSVHAFDGAETLLVMPRLLAAGRHHDVATILAATHWSRLHLLGLSTLRVALAELADDVLVHHVQVLVAAAQFAESEQRATDARAEWLLRADRLAAADDPIRPLLEVELARDLIRDLDLERGRELAARALDTGDPLARARALHTLAKIGMWDGTAEGVLEAERSLRDAISSYRMHGEDQWEATAWLELGWTHNLAGAFDRSLDAIGRSVHLLGAASSQRASTLTFQADVLVEVGRYEEAMTALREARTIARDLDDHAGLAYAAWGLARLHSRRRDLAGTLAQLRQVELHRTDWYRRPAGASFHGEAAEMLVHLGDGPGALDHLARAERLDADHHTITDVPRAMYEARFGDPGRAGELLAELIDHPTTWERNRWRYLIYAAWAAHRCGDEERATSLAALAVRSVEALGHPELLAIGEPELHAHFFGGAPADDRWELRLLGEFELRRNGVVVRVPPGSGVWLVQHLAVFGARTVDEVTDRLWPDADTATARRRLRNLLNRVRAECGALVERDDVRLRLCAATMVDLWEFQRSAAEVAAAPAVERSGHARVAIARVTGPLLGDVADDDVAVVRERVRRQVVDLLDLVAADALERSDLAEAARLREQAVELEPYDESRYVALAEVLLALDRRRSARDVVSRGLAIATDLDVDASPQLARLARDLAVAD
jgi:DNA-binding SARP family transcriptional activator